MISLTFHESAAKALNMIKREDPKWLCYCNLCLCTVKMPTLRNHELARKLSQKYVPHQLIVDFVSAWDYSSYLSSSIASAFQWVDVLQGAHMTYALNVHGDIKLAREWLLKIVEVMESFDIRNDPSSLGDYAHVVPVFWW